MTIHLADTGSIVIVTEQVFGSVIAPALIPGDDVFDDAISIPFEMAEVVSFEPEVAPRNEMRRTRGRRRPDTIGVRVAGKKKLRRPGTLSLSMRIEGVGDGDPALHPVVQLVDTLLEAGDIPEHLSDAVLAYHDPAPGGADGDVFHFRPTNIDRFSPGQVIATAVEGRPVLMFVTDVDDTAGAEFVRVLGAPRHLTVDDEIRFCLPFKPKNLAARPSLAMRFDKPGYRAKMYGCRLTEFKTTLEPRGEASVLRIDFSFAVAHVRYDHDNAEVTQPAWPAGHELQFLGGDATLSEALPDENAAGPYMVGRAGAAVVGMDGEGVLDVGQLEVTVKGELVEAASHRSITAGQNVVRDVQLTSKMRLTQPMTGFDLDFADGVDRFFAFCCGSPGQGNGFGIVVPTAFSSADSAARTESDELIVQDLSLDDGIPRGTKDPASSDAPFIVAVVL